MPNKDTITQGVKCVVNTCQYYKQGDQCTAGEIQITPKNANSSEETGCATFNPNGSIH